MPCWLHSNNHFFKFFLLTDLINFYYESPGQQPWTGACLHAQGHGYWTGKPVWVSRAEARITNTGGDCGSTKCGAIDFHGWWCLCQQTCPFTKILWKTFYFFSNFNALLCSMPRHSTTLVHWTCFAISTPTTKVLIVIVSSFLVERFFFFIYKIFLFFWYI